MKTINRNSSIELLRIIAIFFIVLMHTYIPMYGNSESLYLRGVGVVIGTLGNTGVTIFMLISGYFGIKLNRKVFKIEFMLLFYSTIRFLFHFFITKEYSVSMFVRSITPLTSMRYWFLSCYVIIAILSQYINAMVEEMQRSNLRRLLITLIFIFYIIPTATNVDILGNGGKDVITLTIVYLVGKYIRYYGECDIEKYIQDSGKKRNWNLYFLLCVGGVLIVNFLLDFVKGGKGFYLPLARDSSIITLVLSIVVFSFFIKVQFNNKVVNRFASYVLAIYIGEGLVKDVLEVLDKWGLDNMNVYQCILFVLTVCVLCVIIEFFRRTLFSKMEDKVLARINL